jgi:polar amino acid transport system substrate-binding protein
MHKILVLTLILASCVRAAVAAEAPNFWDPGLHRDRPEISGLRAIRFLTEDDYPPLNFARADGDLAGFNVEIARAVCEELMIGCTIQARRFETLVDSLESSKGDAIVASIAATPELRGRIDFTLPYYTTPARFAARKDASAADATPAVLEGKTVAVVAGSAQARYLATFFPGALARPQPDFAALAQTLRSATVDVAFADGLTLAVWLAGEDSADCCEFRGGPFTESRFFGEGVGIAVRKDDVELRLAIDWALARIAKSGKFAEIYFKYFPVGFY